MKLLTNYLQTQDNDISYESFKQAAECLIQMTLIKPYNWLHSIDEYNEFDGLIKVVGNAEYSEEWAKIRNRIYNALRMRAIRIEAKKQAILNGNDDSPSV